MNETPATWTVNDLARLAAAALAAGSPTQPNGRIREVPDVRTIRWYTSIGLLDRPAAMRGRTALYGRPHLAQLVAIKRLQAGGLTVAAVQERLLGADAAAIEAIAMLPADLDDLPGRDNQREPHDSRSQDSHSLDPLDRNEPTEPTEPDSLTAEPAPRARFWTSRAAPRTAEETLAPAKDYAAPAAEPSSDVPAVAAAAPLVHGLRLAADVTLLLPPGRVPDAADRAALAEAARPLLDLLDRLGLTEA